MPDRFGECDEPEPTPEPGCATEPPRRAINECDLCDLYGYTPTRLVCDHIDHRPAAERGRRLVTQALNQARQRKAAEQ